MLQECNQTDYQREIGVVLVGPERYNFDFTYSFNNYFNSNPTFVRKEWICGLSSRVEHSSVKQRILLLTLVFSGQLVSTSMPCLTDLLWLMPQCDLKLVFLFVPSL